MKRLLVDKCISNESINFLKSLDFKLIYSTEIAEITNSTSTHPDMQFVKIDTKKAIVASQSLKYYNNLLPDFDLIPINNIRSPYPYDTLLNFVLIGDVTICTKNQFDYVEQLKSFKQTFIKQGYAKCSICVLNDNAIITGDRGIAKSLEGSSIKAYYLPSDEIKLKGYENGFWGGASGLIEENKLFFNGNIESLSCYNDLIDILNKQKIEPVYPKQTSVYDNGSIILLD